MFVYVVLGLVASLSPLYASDFCPARIGLPEWFVMEQCSQAGTCAGSWSMSTYANGLAPTYAQTFYRPVPLTGLVPGTACARMCVSVQSSSTVIVAGTLQAYFSAAAYSTFSFGDPVYPAPYSTALGGHPTITPVVLWQTNAAPVCVDTPITLSNPIAPPNNDLTLQFVFFSRTAWSDAVWRPITTLSVEVYQTGSFSG